jgi:hypothetical protein
VVCAQTVHTCQLLGVLMTWSGSLRIICSWDAKCIDLQPGIARAAGARVTLGSKNKPSQNRTGVSLAAAQSQKSINIMSQSVGHAWALQ